MLDLTVDIRVIDLAELAPGRLSITTTLDPAEFAPAKFTVDPPDGAHIRPFLLRVARVFAVVSIQDQQAVDVRV